ncbi:MAG: family 43 glycosylhydrolase [Saprospiraceae bacterium]|jgi:hypothetical protein|nr:family 43 glycosylhydrolase [Saprospiraceae bacterium]
MKYVFQIAAIFYGSVLFSQNNYTQFEPGNLWLDDKGVFINAHGGGFLFHEGTYYWFGEHKLSGEAGNKAMVGVHVYSSKDLYNWTDGGIALRINEDTSNLLQKGCIIERPKVVYNKKNKKFVMWFHHELKDQGYSAALAGIAVSDHVTGPYRYIHSTRLHKKTFPLNFSKEQMAQVELIQDRKEANVKQKIFDGAYFKRDFDAGQMSRDFTLFVDDDETAYHITASEENQTLLISKLSDDYLSLTKEFIRAFPGGRNEAPAIFKKDGKYFMFTSDLTGWKPNAARLAVSDDILGDWKFLGNPCRGSNAENATTFISQSTYVIPVMGKKDAYIFAADRWRPENAIDGRYIWLPIQFENGYPILKWFDAWDLSIFDY